MKTAQDILYDRMVTRPDGFHDERSWEEQMSEGYSDQIVEAMELYASQFRDRLKELEEEGKNLRSVMIAAAEEIQSHWGAHLDEDGYGPTNLMHRLEKGIAASYSGYNAGQFSKLEEDNEKLRKEIGIMMHNLRNT